MPTTGKVYLGSTLVAGGAGSGGESGELVAASQPTGWVRNRLWLPLAPVGDTEEAFRGLLAVYPYSTFAALTASGPYTVDWGDGTTETYGAAAVASHLYDFNSPALAGTDAPVTLTEASASVERASHGCANGTLVRFYNVAPTLGITELQNYYVINATADTFQISNTPAGPPIAFTGNGSAALLPYKQVVVTVTPQSGQNLTALDLNVRHPLAGSVFYDSGWLDIEVGSPSFSSNGLIIATNSLLHNVYHQSCERVAVRNFGGVKDLSYGFASMAALAELELASTAGVTSMARMLRECRSLQSVPWFDTSSVTIFQEMFYNCTRLQSVPKFNLSSAFVLTGMFSFCRSLRSVPAMDASAVTGKSYVSSMFDICSSLSRMQMKNIMRTFSVANCSLSAQALNEIYTNLPVTTGETITVSGNWGTTGDDPSIATAKGWTVSG